ncbi:L-asparaginase II [Terracoccus luteus]|uniref:L-asparaginase II n=1 Tax=Terracoccus luteus TaxID=53356 RepID=A0A839PU87_9MICO|nr:L-asparaginase II [Terracoccus luteus]MCP2172400.1 L-asparaginase II [Terracoccus luteus]
MPDTSPDPTTRTATDTATDTTTGATPDVSPALTDAPVVLHVVRGGFVESVHRGAAVVTGPDGQVELAVGDPSGPVFPRSSSKPLQALAMVRHGLDTDGELLAIACASHSGEAFHLDAARAILAGAGLTEADLQNTPDHPYDETARTTWIGAGSPKQSIAQNCSGKHASMLATCVVNGWDTATYRDPGHPLQRVVTDTVAELTGGAAPVAIAVDGCGAPIHAVPLTGLALAFGRLAAATDGPERRVANAMSRHPEYVGGTRRDVTATLRGIERCVAKDGAESVYALGLPDGRGVAVKVADGSPRGASVLLAAVLRRIGVGGGTADDALAALENKPVLGHGEPVGAVVAALP